MRMRTDAGYGISDMGYGSSIMWKNEDFGGLRIADWGLRKDKN